METASDLVQLRLNPRRSDRQYLVFADLRMAVASVATTRPIRVLDFGADLSPYRTLFPNAEYLRADISLSSGPDILIQPDGSVPFSDASFDLVLSTQVLEHVERPSVYLLEARRLVRPGGKFFASTHGSYEDHGFPSDYQRWTAAGLRRDLLTAGFSGIEVAKVTVGPRAGAFHLERCIETTFLSRRSIPGVLHFGARLLHRNLRPVINFLADTWYHDFRVVQENIPFQNTYIVLAATATVPGGD